MSSHDRRAAGRRRAWGRGPIILRFEPLEGRRLPTTIGPMADVVATQFNTVHTADWGTLIHATGTIANQGTATTTAPVEVDIYASTTPTLTAAGAITDPLGAIEVPAGLQPGGSYNFDQIVALPASPTAGKSASQALFITLKVDPFSVIPEASLVDKQGLGLGIDTSTLTISPHQPAILVGNSISVSPISTSTLGQFSWGDSFNVTEQIQNTGQGDAPPTRARIVLTPAGGTQGGYSDVTIGEINVPAIPAFQTTNVVQAVTLPAIEPLTLGGATSFTISVVQDADFLTQPIYPEVAGQGAGLDQGPLGIFPGPLASTPQGPTPDLAPASVLVSSNTLYWGQQFQVAAEIQNVSNVDAGPFRVRFVATSSTGDVSHGIFVGDAMVNGLAANSATNVLATVQLPAKLPFGTTVASPLYARIYAITDPEDVLNESMRSNNLASSAPVLLLAAGTDGTTTTTVPTYPQNIYTSPVLVTQAAKQVAKKQATKAAAAAAAAKAARAAKLGLPKPASVKKAPPKHKVDLLASISESITKTLVKQIKGIPKGVSSLLKDIGGGGSSGTSSTASTSTPTTAASPTNTTVGNSGGTGGFAATGV